MVDTDVAVREIEKAVAVVDECLATWPSNQLLTIPGLRFRTKRFFEAKKQGEWFEKTFHIDGWDTLCASRLDAFGYRRVNDFAWAPK